jgi:fatty acid CoA ligase FadD9
MVKTDRFMGGYYKRPDLTSEKVDAEGFYRTGDVMAELGPDHLVFVDRCNNVIKLSQGEFVAISRLEALYANHPAISQIYLYGTSERAFLLAIIVPDAELLAAHGGADGAETLRAELRLAMQQVADDNGLASYEVPRDFIVETEPFSLKNGLLSEIGKHQRPKLRDRYGPTLEGLYTRMAQDQVETLRALRQSGNDRPVVETVAKAVQATLGLEAADVQLESRFSDLGGDSLSALTFSSLLEEIFGVEVPVGVIIGPTGSVRQLANFIEAERSGTVNRATFASVHGADAERVQAADLMLDKFIDPRILADAPALPMAEEIRTVLLTGATGFLGRFQAMTWMERMAATGGKLVLVARGADAAQARARVEAAIESDPELLARFQALAADHLEVIPGDLALPDLGLDEATWNRLAGELDAIVHTGAHVNHVLPYTHLFGPNVVGTADLIRLALTTRLKHFHYVSTMGVSGLGGGLIDEDGDIRQTLPSCALDDSYANGYGVSKWASEVLLREAHDLTGLPVSVFRPGMILAHSRFKGQLNVPDMFTRLLFSIAVTGVAPATFYAQDLSNGQPNGRYEAFSVDYLADVVTAIGVDATSGYISYNMASPHEGDASLDRFVDWMLDAGCAIQRVDRYDDWVSRFETAMHALPEEKRAQSMLTILDPYRKPQHAGMGQSMPLARFEAAAAASGHPIPTFSADLIHKYVADLRHLNLL